MICRRCKTENPEASRYCSNCGALLTGSLARPRRSVPWHVLAGAGALVVLAAAYFLVPGLRKPSRADETAASAPAAAEAVPGADPATATGSGETRAPSRLALVAGRFSVEGLRPGAPAVLDSAVVDGSWAALPVWAFLGPSLPRLESPGPAGARPAWCDWRPASPVVLCRLDLGATGPRTPELAPFDETEPLEWRPLSGERTSYLVETGPLRQAGPFRTFALFEEIEAPGALVQEGAVVGWTFGQGVDLGYLWSPADGAGPRPALATSDLVLSVRGAAPREAALVEALSLSGEVGELRRLEALAAGFLAGSLLAPEDLPSALRPSAVATRMAGLAEAAVKRGLAAEVARLLDPSTLAAVSDINLLKAAAQAANEARGFDAVHRLLADVRREPAFQGGMAAREIEALEVELAKSSLRRILDERGYGGRDIFGEASRLAPDDLDLHFLGVEVAVLDKDFVRASDLLDSRRYPESASDKARTLARVVEEGLRDQEAVTIRFHPGDKLIPVDAVLNGTYRQKFFIDTGATTTIIPSAAVAALGIRIDNSTPVVGFQGVAGGDIAYQVPLESIDIEGQKVFDVRVIVYDLGDDENAGLLGNDVLQHFQIDLDSIKGVLKLRKK
jgi:predicted aspartyl protease